jgi:hypothetical protein
MVLILARASPLVRPIKEASKPTRKSISLTVRGSSSWSVALWRKCESSWVAAVASVPAGAHQPEGARRGGKEAAEVACADRDEGASEDQAPEEDLARQVESVQACPAALRGSCLLGGKT